MSSVQPRLARTGGMAGDRGAREPGRGGGRRSWPILVGIGLAGLATTLTGLGADWPGWRGPTGDGRSAETEAPRVWSRKANENVRWRAVLPEPGNSTPIVWGDQVFLTQAAGELRSLLALDRHTGKMRWSKGLRPVGRERSHRSNPQCASSPVTDGERVYAWLGNSGFTAFGMDGRPIWAANPGRQDHLFGYASSPVVDGERVYLNFGPGVEEFVIAWDKRTGRELWRVQSPVPGRNDAYGTWSTPFLVSWNGTPQLLVALREFFAGLEPATGAVIWQAQGMGLQAKASPIAGEGIALISGDLKGAEIAVRLGGAGDVTETHRLWREAPPRGRIGTGVIHDGHLYGARANGLLDCVNLETGDVVWAERQPGGGSNAAVWSSPILVGDVVYVVNQGGDTVLFKASTRFEVLGVNALEETCNASPVVAYGDLFIRTWSALWCIRSPPAR